MEVQNCGACGAELRCREVQNCGAELWCMSYNCGAGRCMEVQNWNERDLQYDLK
jgi:hypothetical protein